MDDWDQWTLSRSVLSKSCKETQHSERLKKKQWRRRPIDLIIVSELAYKKSETRNQEYESWIDIAM